MQAVSACEGRGGGHVAKRVGDKSRMGCPNSGTKIRLADGICVKVVDIPSLRRATNTPQNLSQTYGVQDCLETPASMPVHAPGNLLICCIYFHDTVLYVFVRSFPRYNRRMPTRDQCSPASLKRRRRFQKWNCSARGQREG